MENLSIRLCTLVVLPGTICLCACSERARIETRNRELSGAVADARRSQPPGMRWIPGGSFQMGSKSENEGPVHEALVSAFWMDTHELTNAEFAQFVAATHHVTVGEKAPAREEFPDAPPDKLVPGALVFTGTKGPVPLQDYTQWWEYRPGANWRHPQGPASSIVGKDSHPVVQVTYSDAAAYCAWAGKRLPTEAEWEFAARGGLAQAAYTWGNDRKHDHEKMANLFEGEFPYHNTGHDGFDRTAPVGSFPPNGYGLVDMAGNVWEWTTDWYAPSFDPSLPVENPPGPETSYDPQDPSTPKRVIKGGSFLCNDAYCRGYRPSSRMPADVNTPMEHLGFRCVLEGAVWMNRGGGVSR
jgi:formylglycine-generating enzyme